ncbi:MULTISPECIES: endonuclease III [Desulfococcus]|jgi:endonuclease-3|uniref:Endonuclease III n=1 Tax=Desulfococcus multivorans DSM 2059 TaxID=1121405 RepID=S7VA68_DESML|nr:endonuclease III [Desulfococcus multivorans]AOY58058.1 Nth: endonuclease III [Desulfococcus multivorans]AQV00420.1 endonuclease III [Desulfococcus multivorans]EPR41373.1 endonuclease III [Desulfococcus multivorans DSM 2059]MDX9819319.1 endonuclease III [Desulfococcus multivorans]SJZ71470.1 DNA-(apurinic or apyrimidinic site) lyase /endonuclease III [Desulfococcus multivorans DSM 2059]
MKSKNEIQQICDILRKAYPDVKTQLLHRNPFELLISTILSAQCTDRQVNGVTPALFRVYPTPDALARAPIKKIEALIRPTGFFHNKARNIRACAAALVDRYGGVVPHGIEELVALPGVGRKTANVVRSAAFGQAAVVVDTHVKRISRRLGLTRHEDPVKIEFDLMAKVPEAEWNDLGLRMIYFGRETCRARKPDCPNCPLFDLCDYPEKTA